VSQGNAAHVAVVSGVAALLALLYVQGHPVDPLEHERFSIALERLMSDETALNQDVLESRYGILRNYDALVDDLGRLSATRSVVEDVPGFVRAPARADLLQRVEAYTELLGEKRELTERFKGVNAIVNNSEGYFPLLATELIASVRASGDRRREDHARDLFDAVLAYDLAPAQNSQANVEAAIEALAEDSAEGWSPTERDLLSSAVDHARTILDRKPELDRIIEDVVTLPTLSTIDGIRERYRAEHAAVTRVATIYRLLTQLVGFLAVLAMAYFFTRMRHATDELERSNERLESRVGERTRALAQSESVAKQAKGRLEATFDTVMDAIITIDARGIVQSANAATEALFGYAPSELRGQNVRSLMPDPYAGEHDGYLARYLETNERRVIGIGREVTGRRKDGSTFPAELAVSEMRVNDERQFVGLVRDIEERKRVQQMKDEFISTVSHELRTPLTSIRGSLGLVLGGAMGELESEVKDLLEIACRNTDRLTRLINDILDIEKIEAGRMDFTIGPVDLAQLVDDAIEANRAYAEQFGARYEIGAAPGDVRVLADPDRLMQVITNLLSNAAKFSPDSEVITIDTEVRDGMARVSVTDRGEGIPEEFRDRVFQKFTQASSSDTRRVGGTGLGLSICKAIMEQMHGAIAFETETGKGTRFYFDIPLDRRREAAPEPRRSGRRVLVCEDDADISQLLRMMLSEQGFECDCAATAAEARRLLRENAYSAMTLDLQLPDQDGSALLQELRADPGTAELPVIVVSATADEERRRLCGDAVEIVDWINKPIDSSRLVEAIRLSFQRSKVGRPRVLHVEDDADVMEVVRRLVGELADVEEARDLATARERLRSEEFELVILDVGLPDGSGLTLLREIRGRIPVLLFSAQDVDALPGEVAATLLKSEATPDALRQTIASILDA
jgi:PAS domain S-box-containing protein